ncbi:hypothetical protein GCM10011405_34050 [Rufibacter glacialis]|nr:hypothetical protein GCM10011405_34050 [Rufibacter glacialis]
MSVLLLVLSFRVGKSVILEFDKDVYLQLIFAGLASLLLIGPLFYLYTKSLLEKSIQLTKAHLLHFAPFFLGLSFSAWTNQENVKRTPIAVFVVLFVLYYGHYLVYLYLSYQQLKKYTASPARNEPVVQWLRLLLGALLALWVVYVLNLVEENIPYILGPILYSIIAYGVSFIAIRKGYLAQLNLVKYKTTPLSEEEIDQVYGHLKKLLEEKELYKDPDLTLGTVSKALKVSPQKISMAVNSRSGANFNGFINQYRIRKAQALLKDEKAREYTIASIAFEVGFNSLTSFNTAFKKETNETPSAYRKGITQP